MTREQLHIAILRIGVFPLIENIEYVGPASKRGHDKRHFGSFGDANSFRAAYSSEIYKKFKSHK